MQSSQSLQKTIKSWILFFIIALVLSGVTAFALETELAWLSSLMADKESGPAKWINTVYLALHDTNIKYPYLAEYGLLQVVVACFHLYMLF